MAWNGERNARKERKRMKAKSKGSLAKSSSARADRKRQKDGNEIGVKAFVPGRKPEQYGTASMLVRNKYPNC